MKNPVVILVVGVLLALNLYQWSRRGESSGEHAAARERPALTWRDLEPDERRRLIDRFTWLWATAPRGMMSNRFLGVDTRQNPFDVWVTQEILFEVKPDFVVEAGTFRGGSAALWAMLLEHINPDGRVITIDIEDQRPPAARQLPVARRKVDFLLGSSTDPAIVQEVKRKVAGGKVLVILDSLHTKDHVLAELEAYADLVENGSYIIVQDSIVNGHPLPWDHGPGPWEAVEEFLAGDDRFEIDLDRERLLVTTNPNGYLRRVR